MVNDCSIDICMYKGDNLQYVSTLEKLLWFCFELNVPLKSRSCRPRFIASSERLQKQRIEPVTLRLQGQYAQRKSI